MLRTLYDYTVSYSQCLELCPLYKKSYLLPVAVFLTFLLRTRNRKYYYFIVTENLGVYFIISSTSRLHSCTLVTNYVTVYFETTDRRAVNSTFWKKNFFLKAFLQKKYLPVTIIMYYIEQSTNVAECIVGVRGAILLNTTRWFTGSTLSEWKRPAHCSEVRVFQIWPRFLNLKRKSKNLQKDS